MKTVEDSMKKGLLSSYLSGISDTTSGESYLTILRYFYPEFISATLLYSLPLILDSYFIGQLSTTSYATLGVTNNIVHFIVKFAEALSVATVILTGQFNGKQDYEQAGETMRDSFWVTCITGLVITLFLYFGAYWIYEWNNAAPYIAQGVPFMKLRAISLFFLFIYLACVGFLRGIKNVTVPMITFVVGTLFFIIVDYVLIFGKWGFPAMGLNGSAIASMVQNGLMMFGALGYIIFDKSIKKYRIKLFSSLTSLEYITQLFLISWPVVLDKVTMAGAYIWLCKMICPMGQEAVNSYKFILDMERFAFLPAIAFAQVITFLVSNDFGAHNWTGIKNNIKKVGFLASLMVFSILVVFSYNVTAIVHFFDPNNQFTLLASGAFPVISVLVFFDLIQLILSGALRGSGNVRTVMYVRLLVCLCYFIPISYVLSGLSIESNMTKFILIYGSFYFGNALMSIAYVRKLRGDSWKRPIVQG